MSSAFQRAERKEPEMTRAVKPDTAPPTPLSTCPKSPYSRPGYFEHQTQREFEEWMKAPMYTVKSVNGVRTLVQLIAEKTTE